MLVVAVLRAVVVLARPLASVSQDEDERCVMFVLFIFLPRGGRKDPGRTLYKMITECILAYTAV